MYINDVELTGQMEQRLYTAPPPPPPSIVLLHQGSETEVETCRRMQLGQSDPSRE